MKQQKYWRLFIRVGSCTCGAPGETLSEISRIGRRWVGRKRDSRDILVSGTYAYTPLWSARRCAVCGHSSFSIFRGTRRVVWDRRGKDFAHYLGLASANPRGVLRVFSGLGWRWQPDEPGFRAMEGRIGFCPAGVRMCGHPSQGVPRIVLPVGPAPDIIYGVLGIDPQGNFSGTLKLLNQFPAWAYGAQGQGMRICCSVDEWISWTQPGNSKPVWLGLALRGAKQADSCFPSFLPASHRLTDSGHSADRWLQAVGDSAGTAVRRSRGRSRSWDSAAPGTRAR